VKVGDLVKMPVSFDFKNPTGVILATKAGRPNRVQIYWIEDAEISWEPIKWLEVISEG